MVTHVVELVDTGDQHAPDQCRGVRGVVRARYCGRFSVLASHLPSVVAGLRADVLGGLSVAGVDHCLEALLHERVVLIDLLGFHPVLHKLRHSVGETL